MARKPKTEMKILLLDVETAPNVVYTWGLYNQNVALNQIEEPGYTLCVAGKWYGTGETEFYSLWEDGKTGMILAVHEMLDEADVVVHYNGTKFDMPVLNRDMLSEGLHPPTNYKQVDLYRVVRSKFRFPSNRLDYVTRELGLGSKTKHEGFELWLKVMAGDEKAQRKMATYNKQDVRLLERLYDRLLPWIPNHPNHGLWVENPEAPVCRNCGSLHVQKKGIERTTTQAYQRFKCMACGANLRGRTRVNKTSEGVLV